MEPADKLSRRLALIGLFAMIWLSFVGVDLRSGASALAENLPRGGDGDWRRQLGYLSAFGLVALGALRGGVALGRIRPPPVFVMLIAWCAASVFWAIAPEIAARRFALTLIVTAVAILAVTRLGVDDTLEAIRQALGAILVIDFLAVAFLAGAVHPVGEADPALPGLWRGLHGHKNTAGGIMAVTFIVFYFHAWSGRSWASALMALGAAVFLYKTGSKTSLAFVPLALACGHLVLVASRSLAAAAVTATGGALIGLGAGWIDVNADRIVGYLDDPTSFTGRNQIWPVLLTYAQDHPALGSGFGSFWSVGPNTPLTAYASGWLETVAHGHNGYLDILAQTGAPGLFLAVAALVVWPLASLRHPRSAGPAAANRSLFAALIVFFAAHNLLETSYLDRDNPLWLLTMLVMACLFALRPGSQATQPSALGRLRAHDGVGLAGDPAAAAHQADAQRGDARAG